jgi:hypothetical protein
MLPEIVFGYFYGETNKFYSSGAAMTVDEEYTIKGNATYAYNTTQELNGTWSVVSSVSDSIVSSSSFSMNFSANSLSAPSAGTHVYNLSVVGPNGSTRWETTSIVMTSGTSESTPASGGGGAGGSGVDYSLSVTSYDSQVSVIQGESASTSFTVKNNGLKSLEDVKLEVVGVPSSWYTISIASSDDSTADLSAAKSVTFTIKFTPPADAEPKSYTLTLKAKDTDGLAIAEKKVTFKVTKVWDTAKISDLSKEIEDIKKDYSEVKGDVKVLEAKGIDTTVMETDLEAIGTAIQNAIAKYNAGEYTESERYYNEADDLIEKIKSAMAATSMPDSKIAALLSGLSLGAVSILIILVLVGGFVGFIVWYKLFRVIPVSEIKKDPDLFVEGARIEGVVKSITETKKGKVFLIQDHTDKLHVRYPYYTTVEQGNLIRAVGSVKTYKDVPYMDAANLHRVSVKHFGGFMKDKGGLHKPKGNFLGKFFRRK